jgi:hypothetical protein
MSGKSFHADHKAAAGDNHSAAMTQNRRTEGGQTLMPQGFLDCHQDIDPEALAEMVGDDILRGLQQKIGLSRADVLGRLRHALPHPEHDLAITGGTL